MNKINLLDLEYDELEGVVIDLGMKKFNAKQIYEWLHVKIARKIDDMTNISKKQRELLEEKTYIPYLNLLNHQVSKKDGTEKFLFKLEDGTSIETVLLKHKDRNTVCLSTQVGCAVKCSFCATGQGGFTRDLFNHEIVNQVYTIHRRLVKKGEGVNNLVYMGMGEPLLNVNNTIKSIRVLSDEKGINISKRRITVSTCGIVPGIEKLLQEKMPIGLAVSLHAVTDQKRNEIIPINRRYPLQDLYTTLQTYQKYTKRRLTFEYILIDEFNCSMRDADMLAEFMYGFDHIVNLIPYNEVEGTDYKRPDKEKIEKFYNQLKEVRKINVTFRGEKGSDIDGACGQLRQKNKG